MPMPMRIIHDRHAQRGVVALITVVIIGALILIIGLAGSRLGQTEIVVSNDVAREKEARALVSACVEEAMYRLKRNDSYVGGTLTIDEVSCVVAVSGSGSTRSVVATAEVSDHFVSVTVGATRKANAASNSHGWSVDTWSEGDPP